MFQVENLTSMDKMHAILSWRRCVGRENTICRHCINYAVKPKPVSGSPTPLWQQQLETFAGTRPDWSKWEQLKNGNQQNAGWLRRDGARLFCQLWELRDVYSCGAKCKNSFAETRKKYVCHLNVALNERKNARFLAVDFVRWQLFALDMSRDDIHAQTTRQKPIDGMSLRMPCNDHVCAALRAICTSLRIHQAHAELCKLKAIVYFVISSSIWGEILNLIGWLIVAAKRSGCRLRASTGALRFN